MKEFIQTILDCGLFAGVSQEELQQILPCLDAKIATFEKEETILPLGEAVNAVGVMLSGSGLIVQEDVWGNRNIVSLIAQGQSFGETFACAFGAVATVHVVAQAPTQVLFLNVKRILTMCPTTCTHHSRIIRNLLADLANKNLLFHEKVTHLGQRTTRAKLLSYLSAQAQHHHGATFDIPFSRQQLADYLSVDRSGLSLELCKLRDEGVLTFHKNHFYLNV